MVVIHKYKYRKYTILHTAYYVRCTLWSWTEQGGRRGRLCVCAWRGWGGEGLGWKGWQWDEKWAIDNMARDISTWFPHHLSIFPARHGLQFVPGINVDFGNIIAGPNFQYLEFAKRDSVGVPIIMRQRIDPSAHFRSWQWVALRPYAERQAQFSNINPLSMSTVIELHINSIYQIMPTTKPCGKCTMPE